MFGVTVRRLTPEDVDILRGVRLRSLQDAPSSFGSSYQRELSFTTEIWRSRLLTDGNPNVVDEGPDGEVVGMVTGLRDIDDPSLAHLVAMWVAPEARGRGAADRLVAGVVGWARSEGFSAVRLRVTDGNFRAEKLYERHGFQRTGATFLRERDGLTEVEMAFRLG